MDLKVFLYCFVFITLLINIAKSINSNFIKESFPVTAQTEITEIQDSLTELTRSLDENTCNSRNSKLNSLSYFDENVSDECDIERNEIGNPDREPSNNTTISTEMQFDDSVVLLSTTIFGTVIAVYILYRSKSDRRKIESCGLFFPKFSSEDLKSLNKSSLFSDKIFDLSSEHLKLTNESVLLVLGEKQGALYRGSEIKKSPLYKKIVDSECYRLEGKQHYHIVKKTSSIDIATSNSSKGSDKDLKTECSKLSQDKEDCEKIFDEDIDCDKEDWNQSHLHKKNLKENTSFSRHSQALPLDSLNTHLQSLEVKFTVAVSERPPVVDLQQLIEALHSLHQKGLLLPTTPKVLLPSYIPFNIQRLYLPIMDSAVLPFNSLMSSHFQRMASFSNWPISAPMSALRMVDAGYYINMQTSKVNCFSCGMEIKTMSELENLIDNEKRLNAGPSLLLRMHNRNRPDCFFAKEELRKIGQEFVDCSNVQNSLSHAMGQMEISPKYELSSAVKGSTSQTDNIQVGRNNLTVPPGNGLHDSGYGSANSIIQNDLGNAPLLSTQLDSLTMANYNHVTPETSTILGPSSIQTETGHIGNYSSKRYDYEETYDYSLKHPQYDTIAERIKSFKNWQYNEKQHYRNLIPAGFFYTGNSDIVRCFCCDIGLAEWDEEDEPWVEHARHSPNCKFLKEKKGEPFINEVQAEWRKIYNPKHPAYMELDTRLNSFQGWPEHLTQRPEDLALAGFFYTGEGDVVRCHYCDGGLREWDPEDTPWTEHAKWFPFCKYIMKVKGISFIEQVGREHEEAEIAANEVSNYTPTITSNNTNNHNIPLSGATEVLFNMGYSRNVVQHIVNIFVERNGHSNYGAEGLVQILLELEERGEVIPTNPPTSQGPRPPRGINNSPSIAAASVLNSNKEEEKKLDPVHIEQENKQLKNNMICVKCKSNERNMVFIPCGHRLMCERCAETENRCTKCNKKVKRRVKTYLV